MFVLIFHLSWLLLAYTYAGYPAWMAVWARWAPRPVQRAPIEPSVAIIVVVHNEEARLRRKIETCLAQDYPAHRVRLVIASDGSSDGSALIAAEYAQRRVTWMAFPERRGKAACLNDAAAACSEDVLVMTDARQMLNPEAVRCLVENLADLSVGAVSGELMLMRDDMTPFSEGVDAYWRYEKFIRQREALVHSAPGVTGALYAIRRVCWRAISDRTILDDVAVPMQAIQAGFRVVFDGRAHAYDQPSKSPAQERVRKVRTLSGNYQLMAMMPWLLSPIENPIFMQFLSHKVLRLVAPFAMLLLLLSNLVLAPGSLFYGLCLAVQLAGYALPLVGRKVPAVARMKITKIATAFLILNGYAVLGLARFLTDRDGHLWQTQASTASGAADEPRR